MEIAFLNAIQTYLGSPFMNVLMPLITHLGDAGGAFWFLVGLVLVLRRQTRLYGIAMLVALVLAIFVGTIVLKPLVARVRPFLETGYTLIVSPPSGGSFPSSHAMSCFAAATVICFISGCGQCLRILKILSVVVAFIVGFSRLYLYVHYPTDVLAGAVMGIVAGVVAVVLVRKLWPLVEQRFSPSARGKHAR